MPYHYYVVDGALPVRVDEDTLEALLLHRDGSHEPVDAYKTVTDGREITEAEFNKFWDEHPYHGD